MSIPTYQLLVGAGDPRPDGVVAIIGRDIRSQPAEIARHCLVDHRAISEDVATIAESVALADRLFSRHRGIGWARQIEVQVPVFELDTFCRSDVEKSLLDAAHFLTGDVWQFHFVKRPGHPISQSVLPFEKIEYRYVMPYSDGLDSYSQAALLEADHGADSMLQLRSGRMGQDSLRLRQHVLRVPRSLGSMPKKEQSYRSRPFVFFSFAGIGAFVAKAESIVIGESGQGALGPPLIPYGGEWPFRSTHPGFIAKMTTYLRSVFNAAVSFEQPQLWRTKGEVLKLLQDRELLGRWEETRSCSVRPANRHGADTCGICGGCLLRGLALHSAGIASKQQSSAFDLWSSMAVARDGKAMGLPERHMAVRSFGTMTELARLISTPNGRAAIKFETRLFGDPDPVKIQEKLEGLIARHSTEWASMIEHTPKNGWANALATQL